MGNPLVAELRQMNERGAGLREMRRVVAAQEELSDVERAQMVVYAWALWRLSASEAPTTRGAD